MNLKATPVKLLLALAVVFTLLNSVKPLCIDDTLYYFHASHLASHPLKPYAFDLYWLDRPTPAVEVLAPTVFPYYWAIGIKLLGSHPFLWKLWLFPFALLLVFVLYAIFRRFASGQEMWLTWLTVISPVFLPSFNLMLEIPVLALSFTALYLFFRAHDQDSWNLALVSGVVAGLAMQTKYTALVLLPLMLLHGVIFRKLRLSITAGLLSIAVFLLVEGLIVLSAGHSHILFQTGIYSSVNPWKKYVYLAWPLLTIAGACAPALALICLVVLGASRRVIAYAAVSIAIGYLLMAFVPDRYSTWPVRYRPSGELITLAHVVFSLFGIAVFGGLLVVIWRLFDLSADWPRLARWRYYKVEWFLLLWLLGELATYFLLSPIPAVRRMLSLLVVSTLLVGRLATKLSMSIGQRALLRAVAIGGMSLGLFFYSVDLHDAFVEKIAVERADQRARERDPTVNRWYFERWGFQFYADRAGMKSVVADESDLHAGDWLLISDGLPLPVPVAEYLKRYRLEPAAQVTVGGWLPLRTMLGFYNSGIPLSHHEGPRRTVTIYRVASDSSQK